MKEISKKLHKKIIDELKPFIQGMINAGMPEHSIINVVHNHVKIKEKQYYVKKRENENWVFLTIANLGKIRGDSKIEMYFYEDLRKNGIDFNFQYKIGPYRVDYFVPDDLVIESDGPHHNTPKHAKRDMERDKYLKKMGYKVLRIPTYLVALDNKAVMGEIKEIIRNRDEDRRSRSRL